MDSTSSPQPASFLQQIKFGFQNIPINDHNRIPTREFLQACEEFVRIFDILGSVAFLPIKLDISGNIEVGEACLLVIGTDGFFPLLSLYLTFVRMLSNFTPSPSSSFHRLHIFVSLETKKQISFESAGIWKYTVYHRIRAF
jgi:hypothetical protein